jgi:hypothetical protein
MGIDKKQGKDILSKLKCVVCCSDETYSEPYEYKQAEKTALSRYIRSSNDDHIILKVYTCEKCRSQFQRWRIYNFSSNGIYVLGLTCVILGILFLIFHQIMGDRGFPLIIIGFSLVVYALLLRFIIGKIGLNPSNYFFYDFSSDIFYIKPEGELEWISYRTWLRSILGEETEIFFDNLF